MIRRLIQIYPETFTKPSRHPFQVFVMAGAILTGMPILLGQVAAPNSLRSLLPTAWVYLWALLFAIGGVLTLTGALTRRRWLGLLIEQAGLGFVGIASGLYVGLLIGSHVAERGSVTIGLLSALAGACVWRFYDIQRTLNGIKNAAEHIRTKRRARGD